MLIPKTTCYSLLLLLAAASKNLTYAQDTIVSPLSQKLVLIREERHPLLYSMGRALPALGVGLAYNLHNERMRNLRMAYTPRFKFRYDDYLQFAPLGAQLGMHTFGIKGSSTGSMQLLVGDAIAVGTMLSLVHITKSVTGILRPDGSSRNSFPSGHTAMAFTSASLFHEEYGSRYPWISAISFGSATAVGIGRMLNNRHWVGDVITGAALGYICGKFGYWISDIIFSPRHTYTHIQENTRPGRFSLYAPMVYSTHNYTPTDGQHRLHHTTTSLGIGLQWRYSSKGYYTMSELNVIADYIAKNEVNILDSSVGVYKSVGVTLGWGREISLYRKIAYLSIGSGLLVTLPYSNLKTTYPSIVDGWSLTPKLVVSPRLLLSSKLEVSLDLTLSHRFFGLRDTSPNKHLGTSNFAIGSSLGLRL